MTDGIQRIFGMEYRPVKDLAVLAPAGLKVIFFALSCLRRLAYLYNKKNIAFCPKQVRVHAIFVPRNRMNVHAHLAQQYNIYTP